MGISRLSEKCRNCPHVDTCKSKKMEAMAYISSPIKIPMTVNLYPNIKMDDIKKGIENLKLSLERGITNGKK